MRGVKGSTDDGGCRSPLFLRWPAEVEPGAVLRDIASVRDLLPTLCAMAGVGYGTTKPLDGMSLKNQFLNINVPAARPIPILVSHWKDKISARSQSHRLDHQGKLYNMIADPNQTLAIDNQSIHQMLKLAIDAYSSEHLSTYGAEHDDRSFIIAHPDSPHTQLPARDGVEQGGIKRSNKFPNDSYFLNWKSTDDKITWSAEVGASGVYAVKLFYAAKEAGGKYHLRFGQSKLDFTLAEANDTALMGAEDDRSRRSESYTNRAMKNSATCRFGEIELIKGTGELELSASELPAGGEGMEFRLFTLERRE